MWIFYVNYPKSNDKRAKINILIVENRRLIKIDEFPGIRRFMQWLIGGWFQNNFIGYKKEADRIILHMRGDRSDINHILEALTDFKHDFEIKHRSLTVFRLGCFRNAPYYFMQRGGYVKYEAYKRMLDIITLNY